MYRRSRRHPCECTCPCTTADSTAASLGLAVVPQQTNDSTTRWFDLSGYWGLGVGNRPSGAPPPMVVCDGRDQCLGHRLASSTAFAPRSSWQQVAAIAPGQQQSTALLLPWVRVYRSVMSGTQVRHCCVMLRDIHRQPLHTCGCGDPCCLLSRSMQPRRRPDEHFHDCTEHDADCDCDIATWSLRQ